MVRIGIIGTGWGASVQAPAFRCVAGAELVAVTSGRRERAHAVAEEFGIPHTYGDYQEMLHSGQVDLVSIVTPPYLHQEMTLAALEAGVHVICEKPFAMDVAQGAAMVAAAARSDRVTAVDHEFRFVPARQTMKRLLTDGEIGEPFLVRISDLSLGRVTQPYGWWFDLAKGGGLFGAIGSHYVDFVLQWIGPITRVQANIRAVIPERPREDGSGTERVTADDTMLMAFELENGGTGRIDLSVVTPGGQRRIEVFGSTGALILEGTKLFRPRGGALEEIQPEARDQARLEDPRLGPTVELAQRVVDRINGIDSGPFPTFADGLQVQRVMDSAHRSSDQRREVAIAEIG